MKNMAWLAAASCLMLSGCGGGDGSSDGGVSVSPAPAPAPTPTPLPTPTPVPAAQASRLSDLSGDFAFSSDIGYLANTVFVQKCDASSCRGSNYLASGALLPSGHLSIVHYYRNPEQVEFGYDGTSITFSAGDRIPLSADTHAKWDRDLSREEFMFARYPEQPLKYTIYAAWKTSAPDEKTGTSTSTQSTIRIALFGKATAPSERADADVFYDGRTELQVGIPGFENDPSTGGGNPTWSYRFADDTLLGSVPINVTENGQTFFYNLKATGKVDRSTNRIEGTFGDSAGLIKGTFRGQMFGPKGVEFGAVFEAKRVSDGAIFLGNFVGIDRAAKANGY